MAHLVGSYPLGVGWGGTSQWLPRLKQRFDYALDENIKTS